MRWKTAGRRPRLPALLLSILLGFGFRLAAEDWPQWRGLNRDGRSSESGLLKRWPAGGPELLWTVDDIGRGHSSPAVHAGRIYVTGMVGSRDWIRAFDLDGNLKWKRDFGRGWRRSNPGVRSTPTAAGNRIFVISGTGEISCLDAADGRALWSRPAFQEFEGESGEWGIAESLLLVDDLLIYTPAGKKTTMAALDRETGKTVWASKSLQDYTGYASPILVEYGGRKTIVNVTAHYIFGAAPENGDILWKFRYSDIDTPTWHPNAPIINIPTPIYSNGRIYVTSGYDHVGVMLQLSPDASSVRMAWKQAALDCHHGGVVLVGGYLYGANWIDNAHGNWVCLDWKTGAVRYEKEWQNKGSILYADGMLYCYEERKGHLALVKPTPSDFDIVSSFQVKAGAGPHWAHPAISGGVLYVRHGETLSAYRIGNRRSDGSRGSPSLIP